MHHSYWKILYGVTDFDLRGNGKRETGNGKRETSKFPMTVEVYLKRSSVSILPDCAFTVGLAGFGPTPRFLGIRTLDKLHLGITLLGIVAFSNALEPCTAEDCAGLVRGILRS